MLTLCWKVLQHTQPRRRPKHSLVQNSSQLRRLLKTENFFLLADSSTITELRNILSNCTSSRRSTSSFLISWSFLLTPSFRISCTTSWSKWLILGSFRVSFLINLNMTSIISKSDSTFLRFLPHFVTDYHYVELLIQRKEKLANA